MPHDATDPAEPASQSGFYNAITAEDDRLQVQLDQITAEQDAGTLSVLDAAHARIASLEAHLAACTALRKRHLGGS
jgi:hypothetical protein